MYNQTEYLTKSCHQVTKKNAQNKGPFRTMYAFHLTTCGRCVVVTTQQVSGTEAGGCHLKDKHAT